MKRKNLPPDDIKFIRNLLRHGSVKWSGRAECLRRARRHVVVGKTLKGKVKRKYHWQCTSCQRWYKNEKQMEVDHIEEVGPFNGDWNDYLLRLFTTQDNLQALCVPCHMKKTQVYNSAMTRWKRKK